MLLVVFGFSRRFFLFAFDRKANDQKNDNYRGNAQNDNPDYIPRRGVYGVRVGGTYGFHIFKQRILRRCTGGFKRGLIIFAVCGGF